MSTGWGYDRRLASSRLRYRAPANCLFVLAAFTLWSWGNGAARADLVFSSGSRSVSAVANTISSFNSTESGTFFESASASFPSLGISATGIQDSITPALVDSGMRGTGSASFLVHVSGIGQVGSVGTSTFDVFFTVDADGVYEMDATVNWTGFNFGPTNDFASLDLTAGTSSLLSIIRTGSTPGTTTVGQSFAFQTGTTYRLVARARALGTSSVPGTYSGSASWSFDLRSVSSIPEPGSLLVGLGVLAWAIPRRRADRL